MAFEKLSMASEELKRIQSTAESAEPASVDVNRFRALGRTQIIGRNPGGSIISREGLEIQQAMERNQAAHRQAEQEE